ncbi:MAG: hypothetical protein JRC99_10615 [Deltaproteobacteria bacterium]|nr:hypothetical protein [Deltaproteobacteria bacterium]
MITTHQSGSQLIGETVTVSYVADPSFGHGRFRLENHGAVAVTAAVKSAWLELGGFRQPLDDITVFDLDQDQMVNPESFKVEAEVTMTFLIGFARFAHEPRFGESTSVNLRIGVNGTELQALSPIEFVRRFPYMR